MAFDFIKKVFTFGRKADEEQAPAPADQPALAPYIGIAPQPAPDAPVEIAKPAPAPVEPAAYTQPSAPTAEILPPIRVPEPIPATPILDDIAPEPSPIPPEVVVEPIEQAPASDPAAPDHRGEPTVSPVLRTPEGEKELPAAPNGDTTAAVASTVENVADLLSPPGRGQGEGAVQPPPTAEILPPIRVPDPAPVEPLIAEVAPEPVVIPDAVSGDRSSPRSRGEGQAGDEGQRSAAEEDATASLPISTAGAAPHPAAATFSPQAGRSGTSGKVVVTKKVEAKAEPVVAPVAPRPSWFQRMREGLSRSSRELSSNIAGVFTKKKLDEETLQDLEDVLIRADLGVETALRVTDTLASTRLGRDVSDAEVRAVMAHEVENVLKPVALPLELDLSHKPHVILVVGVNGTGKTTTIGKLAAKLTAGGLNVMLAAGDTFRAAAIEQLKIWGERTNSPVIATKLGADAAGLAYDAFEKAKAAGSDVLIIDTAGRLQNKAELMAELEKIVRVLGKLDPEAPHTVLQTVDATTGQNALNQVEIFRNVAGVNGLVMTKLDGTARGGILVAIAAKHRLPVYFIGVGEQVDDLEPFSASEFARAIAGVQ
jgi:fused signal recognition particle receptor